MKWLILIRPQAERDLMAARDWYDQKQPGLADSFLSETADAIRELEQAPDRPSLYYRNFRRVMLHRFPYKVFYQVIGRRIVIFRVLHASQCHVSGLEKAGPPAS